MFQNDAKDALLPRIVVVLLALATLALHLIGVVVLPMPLLAVALSVYGVVFVGFRWWLAMIVVLCAFFALSPYLHDVVQEHRLNYRDRTVLVGFSLPFLTALLATLARTMTLQINVIVFAVLMMALNIGALLLSRGQRIG